MTRKELMQIMPANGDDLAAAERIVEIGYPTIIPVMRDMVNWLRLAESPVADVFAALFGRLGLAAVDVINQGLKRNSYCVRHRILTQILPLWSPDAIRQLSSTLTMIATQPDFYDNDILCIEILAKHRIADLKWLEQWFAFKKEQWTFRSNLLSRVEETMKIVQETDSQTPRR